MAEDTETTTTAAVETQTETTPEVQATPDQPKHPLEPGGVRFEQVYREMKESQREATTLRERLARIEGQLSERQQPPPTPPAKFYTEAELQSAVDAGRITPAQMAGQLALQVAAQTEQRIDKKYEQRLRAQTAVQEVNEYIGKIPALGNTTSPEFQKVTRAAYEIADEMGADVRDPRVQRRALRETFGPLESIAKVTQATEFSRRHADLHTETGGGGGQTPKSDDPLKQVSKDWLTYWQGRVSPADLKDMATREMAKAARRRR